jgi:hypothetical protein
MTFTTERLPLAIYLHASRFLAFARCECAGNGKVVFIFDDPDGRGPELELEFDCGAPLSASALFASQKFLRRKMTETLNIGESHAHTNHR